MTREAPRTIRHRTGHVAKRVGTDRSLTAAFIVALVATVGSLTFSGVPAFGLRGMALFPCELCWYQRILMYPLVVVLAVGLIHRHRPGAIEMSVRIGLALAVPGLVLAVYHSLIQFLPHWEIGACSLGSCAAVQYLFLGIFSIPNLSALAFAFVVVSLVVARLASDAATTAEPGGT